MKTEILQAIEGQLIEIVLQLDVLFTPFAWKGPLSGPAAAAIHERRTGYFRRGLPLIGGGAAAERQSHHRLLMQMRSANLVAVVNRGRQRGVKLTDYGEQIARALTPGSTVQAAWPLLRRAAKLTDAGQTNCGFVGRHEFPGGRDAMGAATLDDHFLPLAVRGYLESSSDIHGAVGFRVTPAGRAALAAGPPDKPARVPEYDPAVGAKFIDAYIAGLADRETWKPADENQVVIPLSAGMWPAPLARRRTATCST